MNKLKDMSVTKNSTISSECTGSGTGLPICRIRIAPFIDVESRVNKT